MACVLIPTIQISPAPPLEHIRESFSPFSSLSFREAEVDSCRSTHLTPPLSHATFVKHLSPLCPPDAPVIGMGLERERFEALLKASRERNALIGAKKAVDLRKEIALKAHRNKQVERRALFLSKILAPPSPTATIIPKTPPESPAIFHYSLPSPGLVSPLALFDSLRDDNESVHLSCHPWVEQVDFRLYNDSKKQITRSSALPWMSKRTPVLPSLDQISARLKTLASTRPTTIVDDVPATAYSRDTIVALAAESSNIPATIEIGRLKMPLRAPKLTSISVRHASPATQSPQPFTALPLPETPCSPFPSGNLQVTTTVVPRTATTPLVQLTEANLKVLNARERKAHDMLSTLRKRTLSTPQPDSRYASAASTAAPVLLTQNAAKRTTPLPLPKEVMGLGLEDRRSRWKRHSAPAELMAKERVGFEHPILSLPGAF